MENKITGEALTKLSQQVNEFNSELRAKREYSGNDLDKDAFLKLLTVQLSKQDPLSPIDNTQFVAQMAQFTSLEQMKNLNTTVGKLRKDFQSTSMLSLIGRDVSYYDASLEAYKRGKVESILIHGPDAQPKLRVAGKDVAFSDITAIHGPAKTAQTSPATIKTVETNTAASIGVEVEVD